MFESNHYFAKDGFPNLKRLFQALSAALLLLTPGFDAAQLPSADGEPPLQLVYPEGAVPPPGEPLSILLAWIFRQYCLSKIRCLDGC